MRKFDTEYKIDALKEILGNENYFRNDVDFRLHALEMAAGAIETAANEARDRIVRAADLELAPRLAELVSILASYNGNVNAIRDATLIVLRDGVDASADTLAKIKTLIDAKAAASHTHVVESITGLSSVLDNKSNVGHSHDISAVSGLENALAGKLTRASNLADLTSASSARNNLGLHSSATIDTTDAANISSGTLSVNRLPSIPPSILSNPIFPIQNVESSPVGSAFALQSSLTKTGNRFPIIANNATQELAAYSGGPGVIDWFWLCSNNRDDASLLKITLDGRVAYNGVVSQFCAGKYAADQAGFNSDFFIASHGYGGSNNVSWSFYLPMPFSNSFNIELTNKSGANIVGPWHVSYRTGIPNNSPRSKKFTAVPQALSGVAPFTEVTLCDLTGIGPGLFAGLYFLFDSFPGNFLPRYSPLEGYFEFYVDGQTTPVYKTTGGEDFLYEHQNYQEDVPNIPSATSKAISLYVGRYRGITCKTEHTMGLYRLFLPDPKPFEQSIKLVYKAGQQPVTPVGAAPAGVNSTGTLTLYTTCYVYHEN